ncbi:hypothetical protein DFS34DRAFT_437685 [Phlyctochytrium arcticum]|nr:hypothetical protein DFS34DRAFT_437685 [Phlyctochytrium arcticum]
MTETTKKNAWIPLEANPDVMNKYSKLLGVQTDSWKFTDVWGLDDDILQFVPRPVLAVILLFPITPAYEKFRKEEEEKIAKNGQHNSPKVYFVRQTISNACGTIGLLHALANNVDSLQLGPGPLQRILKTTEGQSPEKRAAALELSTDLEQVHEESSQGGQTRAPSRDDDVDTHFVAFIEKEGDVYEMDGRKPFPINHGKCEDLLKDSARIIKQFMERDPDNLNFTVIALAPAQDF